MFTRTIIVVFVAIVWGTNAVFAGCGFAVSTPMTTNNHEINISSLENEVKKRQAQAKYLDVAVKSVLVIKTGADLITTGSTGFLAVAGAMTGNVAAFTVGMKGFEHFSTELAMDFVQLNEEF